MVQCIQRFYQSMISDCIDLVCSLSRISTDKMTTIQNKTKRSFSCSCRIPQFVIRNSTMDGFAPTLGKPRNFGLVQNVHTRRNRIRKRTTHSEFDGKAKKSPRPLAAHRSIACWLDGRCVAAVIHSRVRSHDS